ncbi:MAG: hypothetical protein A3J38_06160 [Gammaproteobacteria bacterium RIFCSPHIGHO2_12_FULL_45_9]|nr:MAG: hypothetical protein A3J38_06160 [Gammaproteobacteria bacterium RIFCSPHIGHO2_12_FULL_45_9]
MTKATQALQLQENAEELGKWLRAGIDSALKGSPSSLKEVEASSHKSDHESENTGPSARA